MATMVNGNESDESVEESFNELFLLTQHKTGAFCSTYTMSVYIVAITARPLPAAINYCYCDAICEGVFIHYVCTFKDG